MYTYEKLFNVDDVDVNNLTKPRLAPSTISMVPKSMEATVVMALSGNRDLQIAKIDVDTAQNDLDSALANFGPTGAGQLGDHIVWEVLS